MVSSLNLGIRQQLDVVLRVLDTSACQIFELLVALVHRGQPQSDHLMQHRHSIVEHLGEVRREFRPHMEEVAFRDGQQVDEVNIVTSPHCEDAFQTLVVQIVEKRFFIADISFAVI